MKNKLFGVITIILSILILTGCEEKADTSLNDNDKGSCQVFECIKLIKPSNTIKEIDEIIGVEGKPLNDTLDEYYWELSDTTGIKISYANDVVIEAIFNEDGLINNKVTFSKYDQIVSNLGNKVTYSDMVSYFGDIEGTLVKKSLSEEEYIWVKSHYKYLRATFSLEYNKCINISGKI